MPIHNPGLTDRDSNRDGAGIGEPDGPMFTVQARPRDAIAFDTTQVTSPGNYSEPKPGDPCHPLAKGQHPPAVAYDLRNNQETGEVTQTLQSHHKSNSLNAEPVVAFQCHGTNVGEMGHLRAGNGNETGGVPFVPTGMAVRRLTVVECERLMGLPDGYTRIAWRNKPPEGCPDGARYRAIGNSMAIPVVCWLGERIQGLTNPPAEKAVT